MQIDRPIAIAVILFVVVIMIFFFVMPQYRAFNGLREEFSKKQAEYNAMKDYYSEIAKIASILQGRKDDLKKIDDALPENPDLGRIVHYLQRVASDSGLTIKNLFLAKSSQANSASAEPQKGAVRDISFSMNILGDHPSLENFLVALEKSDRIFEITGISFGSAIAGAGNEGFSLQIKTYSY